MPDSTLPSITLTLDGPAVQVGEHSLRVVSRQPAPELARHEANMITYGVKYGEAIAALTGDSALGATFYDAARVYYHVADYTGDSRFLRYAEQSNANYRNYVEVNGGGASGIWIFPDGLIEHYKRTGDERSKLAVIAMNGKASYSSDLAPLAWTVSEDRQREVAYNLRLMVLCETQLGQPHRKRADDFLTQALGHLDRCFVSKVAAYVRPFMVGLTSEALITFADHLGDSRILPALQFSLESMWAELWVPDKAAFRYTDRVTSTGGTEPAPDLNLLIAPAYAWLCGKTGDAKWRERADAIFAGGVRQAFMGSSKHFNQNYRWSFDYLKWR